MIRTIWIRDDAKYKVSNVPIALYLLKLRKLLSGHMYGRILSLRKVYDLATENIRSLDFEPIRWFCWVYLNIQLKAYDQKPSFISHSMTGSTRSSTESIRSWFLLLWLKVYNSKSNNQAPYYLSVDFAMVVLLTP